MPTEQASLAGQTAATILCIHIKFLGCLDEVCCALVLEAHNWQSLTNSLGFLLHVQDLQQCSA